MDKISHFSFTYSIGNKYIMILYNYDSKTILTESMKSRSEVEIIRAYSKLDNFLTRRGFRPKG